MARGLCVFFFKIALVREPLMRFPLLSVLLFFCVICVWRPGTLNEITCVQRVFMDALKSALKKSREVFLSCRQVEAQMWKLWWRALSANGEENEMSSLQLTLWHVFEQSHLASVTFSNRTHTSCCTLSLARKGALCRAARTWAAYCVLLLQVL